MSLRGLAMLNGGSQTWTLNGYQGFISSAAAVPAASASAAHPPSTAKPIVFIDCVMPLSPSIGSRLESVGAAVISSLAAGRHRRSRRCALPADGLLRKFRTL